MFDAPANAVEHEMFKSKGHPRFLAVPPKPEFKVTSMRTLMCHITSPVLSELVPFAKSLLALPTLESPSSPENRATRNSRDRRNSAPGAGGLAPYGGDMGANRRKSGFPVGTGASIAGERIRFKGKGRSQIAMAQLHMLTGRVPDALKE